MYSEKMLLELIEKEREHLNECEIGTNEYGASLQRIINLEDKLADVEKFKKEQKDKFVKNCIEVGKAVGGIVMTGVGLVCITAAEKEITFRGALKDYARLFVPKKMF